MEARGLRRKGKAGTYSRRNLIVTDFLEVRLARLAVCRSRRYSTRARLLLACLAGNSARGQVFRTSAAVPPGADLWML